MSVNFRIVVAPSGFSRRARILEKKRWMKGTGYYKRVDKKWEKRYGFTFVETMERGKMVVDKDRGLIMCRQDDYSRVSRLLDEATCESVPLFKKQTDMCASH